MFELSYPIEDVVVIDKKSYEIDMSFDNILLLLALINDEKLPNFQKVLEGINLLLGVSFLLDHYNFAAQQHIFNQLIEQIFPQNEVHLPHDIDGKPIPLPRDKNNKTYDLKHDAAYIYASFMQAYGIDLFQEQGQLHWYKFQALLSGLPEDTKLKQVIGIRTRKAYKGMPSEERRQLRELQEYYALPESDIES